MAYALQDELERLAQIRHFAFQLGSRPEPKRHSQKEERLLAMVFWPAGT